MLRTLSPDEPTRPRVAIPERDARGVGEARVSDALPYQSAIILVVPQNSPEPTSPLRVSTPSAKVKDSYGSSMQMGDQPVVLEMVQLLPHRP